MSPSGLDFGGVVAVCVLMAALLLFVPIGFPCWRESCFRFTQGLRPGLGYVAPPGLDFGGGGRGSRLVLAVLCCQLEWLRFRRGGC
jgi:hypothetical protein